jgi:allantoate deiminase
MGRCDILGAISEEPDRLTRRFATDAMHKAQEQVAAWMGDAGLTARHDNIGNLRGRYEGAAPEAPTLLVGSHLDSVRDAGKYDGPLGVVVAIAAVQALHDAKKRLPYAIEVVAFADEEGLRFSSTYLGSRALAGTFDLADLGRVDEEGTTMADAIRQFGGNPDRLAEDRWRDGKLLGYCEVHIEQGPVLEARARPVGVVSAIAGQGRYRITFTGQAGHAGTVPMGARRDALAAAAEFVLAVEADASSHDGVVATVGQLAVRPGAVNVVPGRAVLSLDVRHSNDTVRRERTRHILERAREIASRRNVDVADELLGENTSAQCAPRLVSLFSTAVEEAGIEVVQLVSGAGHDAVPMASLTDVGMLFVRCKGGVSHNPAEAVTTDDVEVSIDVLGRFLDLLGRTAAE